MSRVSSFIPCEWPTDKRFVDITGKKFGKMTVLRFAYGKTTSGKKLWVCGCDCGNEKLACGELLKAGKVRSCGCYHSQIVSKRFKKHGHSRSVEHKAWRHIKDRCLNPKARNYKDYGGRGITVCDRWKNSFPAFLKDMGKRPKNKTSIGRIKNDEGYQPGNCRWEDDIEQNNNTRRNKKPNKENGTKNH